MNMQTDQAGKPGKEQLLAISLPFFDEIRDKTAGTEVEAWLNRSHGPGSALYEGLARLITRGVADGWAANEEIGGPNYRRSRIFEPSAASHYFSITAVYMNSAGNTQANPGGSLRGEYHAHPYGEFNLVVPLNPGAELAGPNGWCEAGWTAPPPGSHHYPEVRGGAVIALFFLPAGRISYAIQPPGDPLKQG
jgi:hypothetical protein